MYTKASLHVRRSLATVSPQTCVYQPPHLFTPNLPDRSTELANLLRSPHVEREQTTASYQALYYQILDPEKFLKATTVERLQTLISNSDSHNSSKMGNPEAAEPVLSAQNMNPAVKQVQYAVRGPIAARAVEIDQEIKSGSDKYGFDHVIKCNIGDAHAMGQKPITYIRQVVAGMLV